MNLKSHVVVAKQGRGEEGGWGGVAGLTAFFMLTELLLFLALEVLITLLTCCKSQYCCSFHVHIPIPEVKGENYVISIRGTLNIFRHQHSYLNSAHHVGLGMPHL